MRRIILLLLVAVSVTSTRADEGKTRIFKFGKSDLGKVPAGWKAEQTGKGEASMWKVVRDNTAPSGLEYVLAQTAKGPASVFNLSVAEDTHYKDLELSVSFKAVAGETDQGGGLVWRYRDHDNYYICRVNPLESNFRAYKVVAGKRTELARKEGLDVKPGQWHQLKVRVRGNQMEGYLDGVRMWQITDETWTDAGKIGLWTKADAQTRFDAVAVKE
jgi:Domain of Unknown Function (DUF1080)